MVEIKICGITNLEDALYAAELGADVGFIFTPKSERIISPEKAAGISRKLARRCPGSRRIGLFLNQDLKYIRKTAGEAGVDIIQLHGNETPEDCKKLRDFWYVWKVLKIGENPEASLERIIDYKDSVDAILLDTEVKGQDGGTGKTFDWEAAIKAKEYGVPIILAGGLNPSNIAQAIAKVNPDRVDVSSGVEIRPGIKDYKKMRDFIETAKTPSILLEIVEEKKIEIARLHETGNAVKYRREATKDINRPSFYYAITAERPTRSLNLIAEFKITSPSNVREGNPDYRENAVPEEIVRIYQENGAIAISCLTDKRFKGNLDYLRRISQAVNLPVLRKDFIIDAAQIYEARYYGADAVLLIAAILSKQQIDEYIGRAYELGMSCLVEVHDRIELEKVLDTRATIIGVNNRDLHHPKFHTDINTTLELMQYVPEGMPIVTESGILTYDDVRRLSDPRINAMLVGTTLMKAPDIPEKMRELQGRD